MNKDLITKYGYEKIVKEFKDLLKEKSFWVKEKEIAYFLNDRPIYLNENFKSFRKCTTFEITKKEGEL